MKIKSFCTKWYSGFTEADEKYIEKNIVLREFNRNLKSILSKKNHMILNDTDYKNWACKIFFKFCL